MNACCGQIIEINLHGFEVFFRQIEINMRGRHFYARRLHDCCLKTGEIFGNIFLSDINCRRIPVQSVRLGEIVARNARLTRPVKRE